MKISLLIIVILLALSANSNAQKVEKYCELVATAKLFSAKVNIDVNFGEERKFFEFKDRRVKDSLGSVKRFNSVVDALNYMGQQGWKLVNAFPVSTGTTGGAVYHFFFKKEFDASEIETAQPGE